jgi:hypothetical protein
MLRRCVCLQVFESRPHALARMWGCTLTEACLIAACCADDPTARPTMAEVVDALRTAHLRALLQQRLR